MQIHEKRKATPSDRYRLPEVTFRRNIYGHLIPDSPEDLNICLALGVELQPCKRPYELIRSVKTMIFVKFRPENDKA